jgi:hypothetical protein
MAEPWPEVRHCPRPERLETLAVLQNVRRALAVWQAREPLLDDGALSGPRNLLPILVTRWAFHSPRDLGPHLFDFPQRLQELG